MSKTSIDRMSEIIKIILTELKDALSFGTDRTFPRTPRPRWCTNGVKQAAEGARHKDPFYISPAKRHFLGVGDAGLEPATSAV